MSSVFPLNYTLHLAYFVTTSDVPKILFLLCMTYHSQPPSVMSCFCCSLWLVTVIVLAVIAGISVVLNISLSCHIHLRRESPVFRVGSRARDYRQCPYSGSSSDADDESESPSGIPSTTDSRNKEKS